MNARDEFGRTSLHMAARDDATPDVITRLIKLGADCKAKTADGQTARDLAQNNEVLHGTEAMQLLYKARFR